MKDLCMQISRLLFSLLFLALPIAAWAEDPAAGTAFQPEQAADFASSASLAAMLFKVVGALILVVGIMVFMVMWLKKMGLTRGALKQGSLVKLIDSKMIAPKRYVAVVQVGTDLLALGVSDQQITMLHHLKNNRSLQEAACDDSFESTASFPGILGKATETIKERLQG